MHAKGSVLNIKCGSVRFSMSRSAVNAADRLFSLPESSDPPFPATQNRKSFFHFFYDFLDSAKGEQYSSGGLIGVRLDGPLTRMKVFAIRTNFKLTARVHRHTCPKKLSLWFGSNELVERASGDNRLRGGHTRRKLYSSSHIEIFQVRRAGTSWNKIVQAHRESGSWCSVSHSSHCLLSLPLCF